MQPVIYIQGPKYTLLILFRYKLGESLTLLCEWWYRFNGKSDSVIQTIFIESNLMVFIGATGSGYPPYSHQQRYQ